jgi:hypothetical protein
MGAATDRTGEAMELLAGILELLLDLLGGVVFERLPPLIPWRVTPFAVVGWWLFTIAAVWGLVGWWDRDPASGFRSTAVFLALLVLPFVGLLLIAVRDLPACQGRLHARMAKSARPHDDRLRVG